ncbi:DUF5958 family protein [Streptomyces rubrogriseus]
MNERDVLLNDLAQGLCPMSESIEWFVGLDQEKQFEVLLFLRHHCVQARAVTEDASEMHPPCRAAPDAYARSADLTRPERRATGKDRQPHASRRTPQGVQAADRGAHACRRATSRALLLRQLQPLVAPTVHRLTTQDHTLEATSRSNVLRVADQSHQKSQWRHR